jgi:hypothetical protein
MAQMEIAPESAKTQRAREKLQRAWEEEKAQFTPKALADTADSIRKWIADNQSDRVHVPKTTIRLFNQNQDAAAISKKVAQFAKILQER